MAKVSGSYQSIIMGVSQQVPQDRRPGQNFDQINLVSDPVRGLCRRHGSVLDGESLLGARNTDYDEATLFDTQDFQEYTFHVGPKEYSLLYRKKTRPVNSQAPAFMVYDKQAHKFIPVKEGAGSLLPTIKSNGVSAVVNVGRFVYLASNNFAPTFTQQTPWASQVNTRRAAVWIRTGAYSRTYKVILKTEAGTIVGEYTTPQSSYPGTLDTSDITPSDSDYQKKVTDRQSAYQTAVTKWIGTASQAIQPENIAQKLMEDLAAKAHSQLGWSTSDVSRVDSHVVFSCPSTDTLIDIVVDDSGDGNSAWAVGNEVAEVARLSAKHWVGKIVRVRPKKADQADAYYMRAEPRIRGNTGWAEVTWVEAAGTVVQPNEVFCFATVESDVFYIAGGAKELKDVSGVDTPGFSPTAVGDLVTSPVPFLFGKQITYMGIIQDRLLVAAGSVLLLSRSGDYLNWWRKSVLTVEDSDPIEMFSFWAGDDVISAGVSYDRSLVLFGARKQYIVSGRQVLTPKNASIVVMSSYEDAVESAPQASGNFVFYAKSRNSSTSIHQIQTGVVVEAPETYEISKQLDTYIRGRPVQILPVMAPNTLFVRTTGPRNELYVYTYLDSPDGAQRLFDSWSKWAWNPILGHILGMTYSDGDILVFTLRSSPNPITNEESWWVVADRFTLNTGLSDRPYLDSMRSRTNYLQDGGTLRPSWKPGVAECSAAIGRGGTRQFLGVSADGLTSLASQFRDEENNIWVGANYHMLTYVVPTNPYIRDQNDKVIINGRLTITKYVVSVADTGGIVGFVITSQQGEYRVLNWGGRILARLSSEVGIQPISTTVVSVPVGREIREFQYRIRAKRWLPLTVTSIAWVGQLFYNQRRV